MFAWILAPVRLLGGVLLWIVQVGGVAYIFATVTKWVWESAAPTPIPVAPAPATDA